MLGVGEVAVVLGHQKAKVAQTLQDEDVVQIINTAEDISQSGSLHSFQFACLSEFQPLDGKSHTLLMDADIVYEFSALHRLVQGLAQGSALLIAPNTEENSEEVRVYGKEGTPQFIGKGLTKRLTNHAECFGEATGIVHLAPADHALCTELVHWLVGNPLCAAGTADYRGFGPARKKTEHEEMSQRLMTLGRLQSIFLKQEMLFMEVDFAHEYEQCVRELYSRILQADHQKYPELF